MEPDASFNSTANPDSYFHFNADPDLIYHFSPQCGSVFCASLKSSFFISEAIVFPKDSVFINVSDPN